MKVFRLRVDVNTYQTFALEKYDRDTVTCSGVSKKDKWIPPSVYVINPVLKAGNFSYIAPGALVVDSDTVLKIGSLLESTGELLPFFHEGQTFYMYNNLVCVDCLDVERTKRANNRPHGIIIKYEFLEDRIPESILFKIPQTFTAEILTRTGSSSEYDFQEIIKRENLSGLVYQEIWSSTSDEDI